MQKLFIVDYSGGEKIFLNEEQSRHISKSLRMKPGDILTVQLERNHHLACFPPSKKREKENVFFPTFANVKKQKRTPRATFSPGPFAKQPSNGRLSSGKFLNLGQSLTRSAAVRTLSLKSLVPCAHSSTVRTG